MNLKDGYELHYDSPLDHDDFMNGDRIVVIFCETYERYGYLFEYCINDFYMVDYPVCRLSYMLEKGWPMIEWLRVKNGFK